MEIINILDERLLETYFKEKKSKENLRIDFYNLLAIVNYCRSIKEKICSNKKPLFYGLLNKPIPQDIKKMLIELLGKNTINCNNPNKSSEYSIICSMGKINGCSFSYAYDLDTYANLRQDILIKIKNLIDFCEIFVTSFPNTAFSVDCQKEMQHIENFEKNREYIIKIIKFLNSKEVLLKRNKPSELEGFINANCKFGTYASNDSKHKKYLIFSFKIDDGSLKKVECQPHIKVGRPNSNLRIYFYWYDSRIGNGEKILIGRIGRHPY